MVDPRFFNQRRGRECPRLGWALDVKTAYLEQGYREGGSDRDGASLAIEARWALSMACNHEIRGLPCEVVCWGGMGYLCHAACNLFEVVVFVRFEGGTPTGVEGKRDRVI